MSTPLPEAPRLRHLKGQAKALAQSVREDDPDSLNRIRASHARFASLASGASFRLADAQFVLAREYGFDSWTKLKQHVAVRDPELLQEAFETVKDGWISVKDVPGDPAKLRRMLRQYPGLVHARIGPKAYTLLHFAAHRNFIEVAKILIAAGADVHARANGGATPLAVALTYPAPDVARLLEPYGRVPDNLRTAAGLGDVDGMRRFFDSNGSQHPEAGADREEWALSYGFAPRPLLHDPADILTEALTYAAQNGHIDAARFLVEQGAEVNRISFIGTPLHWTALYNQREAVDYLLSAGADVNALDDEFNGIAAGWADYFGGHDLAKYLMERGANVMPEESDRRGEPEAGGDDAGGAPE